METLGQRIKRLRQAQNLSLTDLGKKVGISRVAVAKWESEMTANLKLENILRLCEIFGITADELLLGYGAANSPGRPLEEQVQSAWASYHAAAKQTRAAIDLLLADEKTRQQSHPSVLLAINVLEEKAQATLSNLQA